MSRKRRGRAIVINNMKFKLLEERKGAQQDTDALGKCLNELQFVVEKHENKTKEFIKNLLGKVAQEDHSDADCIVISLMSHGGTDGICAIDYKAGGSPGEYEGLLTLSDITDPLKGDNCPTLAGKPKIFILNACRGELNDHGVAVDDGESGTTVMPTLPPVNKVPICADIFICFSCCQGYSSLRNASTGSYFIQDLSKVLTTFGRTLHLNELILMVKEIVAGRLTRVTGGKEKEMQMPVVIDTLRKLVYFDKAASSKRQPSDDILMIIKDFE